MIVLGICCNAEIKTLLRLLSNVAFELLRADYRRLVLRHQLVKGCLIIIICIVSAVTLLGRMADMHPFCEQIAAESRTFPHYAYYGDYYNLSVSVETREPLNDDDNEEISGEPGYSRQCDLALN